MCHNIAGSPPITITSALGKVFTRIAMFFVIFHVVFVYISQIHFYFKFSKKLQLEACKEIEVNEIASSISETSDPTPSLQILNYRRVC